MNFDSFATFSDDTPTSSGVTVGKFWPKQGREPAGANMHLSQPHRITLVNFTIVSRLVMQPVDKCVGTSGLYGPIEMSCQSAVRQQRLGCHGLW